MNTDLLREQLITVHKQVSVLQVAYNDFMTDDFLRRNPEWHKHVWVDTDAPDPMLPCTWYQACKVCGLPQLDGQGRYNGHYGPNIRSDADKKL